MNEANHAAYPFSRSFVVQFREGSGPGARGFVGRVEHLRSGRRAHFCSRKELFAFMESVLVSGDEAPPEGGTGAPPSNDWGK